MASEVLKIATFRGDADNVQALLTAGGGTTCTVLSVTICETGNAAETFDLLVDDGGGGDDTYIYYNTAANTFNYYTGSTWVAVTAGGITSLAADGSPQLGGALDVNGQSIVSVSNGNILITPHGTGKTIISGSMNDTLSTTGKAMVIGF